MIIINFKNYKTGKQALDLAKKIQKHLPSSIVAVPTKDVEQISKKTKLKVFTQYIKKTKTGKGSLLNHSDHQITFQKIKGTIKESQDKNFKIILCTSNLKQAKKFKALKPWAMAFEDRKLIGSGKSITQYRAGDVERFAKLLKNTKIIPLCGAGVSTAEDVRAAKHLGCKGVLIASAIAKASNPDKLLKKLSRV